MAAVQKFWLQMAEDGCSSETKSHPINKNKYLPQHILQHHLSSYSADLASLNILALRTNMKGTEKSL
jgi:hypothetical protein